MPRPLKKGQPPQCSKCSVDHWPFVKCADVPQWAKDHAERKARAKPEFIEQPREGFRPWGDRLNGYQNLGGNLVLDRPIVHGRNVREPDDWGRSDADA